MTIFFFQLGLKYESFFILFSKYVHFWLQKSKITTKRCSQGFEMAVHIIMGDFVASPPLICCPCWMLLKISGPVLKVRTLLENQQMYQKLVDLYQKCNYVHFFSLHVLFLPCLVDRNRAKLFVCAPNSCFLFLFN